MGLPKPTKTKVLSVAKRERTQMSAQTDIKALRILFGAYPKNACTEEILLKATVLNDLYSTQIFNIRDAGLAIKAAKIDRLLNNGSLEAVARIQEMEISGKKRSTYSFATKYCSFHKPEIYPIYDEHVKLALVAYQEKDSFAKFSQISLRDYLLYVNVLNEFRQHYGLQDVPVFDLDKFLWRVGADIKQSKALER